MWSRCWSSVANVCKTNLPIIRPCGSLNVATQADSNTQGRTAARSDPFQFESTSERTNTQLTRHAEVSRDAWWSGTLVGLAWLDRTVAFAGGSLTSAKPQWRGRSRQLGFRFNCTNLRFLSGKTLLSIGLGFSWRLEDFNDVVCYRREGNKRPLVGKCWETRASRL